MTTVRAVHKATLQQLCRMCTVQPTYPLLMTINIAVQASKLTSAMPADRTLK